MSGNKIIHNTSRNTLNKEECIFFYRVNFRPTVNLLDCILVSNSQSKYWSLFFFSFLFYRYAKENTEKYLPADVTM